VLDAIYLAATDPERWPDALEATANFFGDVGGLLIYQRADRTFATVASPGLAAAQAAFEQGGWWRHDFRMSRAMERGYILSREAVTDRHLASDEEIEASPYYRDFLGAFGLKWFAGMMISPDPEVAAALSIQRSAHKSPYSDAELDAFEFIARHVENALRIGIRLISAEVANLTLLDAFDRLDMGVFLLDGLGRIVFSNEAARGVSDESWVGAASITSGDRPATALLRKAIEDCLREPLAEGWAPRPVLVRRPQDGNSLAIYALPMKFPSTLPMDRLLAAAKVLLLVAGTPRSQVDPAAVRDLLDLTLGEARLAALVGNGIAPREAAARLGITEQTARSVLKRVFAKTGTSRQSELAGLITRLVLR
jgi:DNA-binding CsgD family transcriptional regulator